MFQCPQCKGHDDNELTIHHAVRHSTKVFPDESVRESWEGDLEWDEKDRADCKCGWKGTVKDMTITETEYKETPTP